MSPYSFLVSSSLVLCLLFVSTLQHEVEQHGKDQDQDGEQTLDELKDLMSKGNKFKGSRPPWELNSDLQHQGFEMENPLDQQDDSKSNDDKKDDDHSQGHEKGQKKQGHEQEQEHEQDQEQEQGQGKSHVQGQGLEDGQGQGQEQEQEHKQAHVQGQEHGQEHEQEHKEAQGQGQEHEKEQEHKQGKGQGQEHEQEHKQAQGQGQEHEQEQKHKQAQGQEHEQGKEQEQEHKQAQGQGQQVQEHGQGQGQEQEHKQAQGQGQQVQEHGQGQEQEQGKVDVQGQGQEPQPQQPQPVPQQPLPQPQPQPGLQQGQVAETNFPGAWEMVNKDAGVSAMHLQLLPNNKLIMFDATSLGKSNIELPPNNCRIDPNKNIADCWAHSVEFDPLTNTIRVLKVITDPWCSSGGLAPDGTLVGTGGWKDGGHTVRFMPPCEGCDWRETPNKLWDERWYGTQVLLGDGRFVVLGGRRAFGYEFLAPENLQPPPKLDLPFFRDTTDIYENNLYPFVHLLPNGNLFVFANNRAIQLDVRTNIIIKNYPDLPGGARNYPGSGSSAILPVDLRKFPDQNLVDIEILICGGGQPLAFGKAEKENLYLPALDSCGKIKALDPAPQWEMDTMPTPRVMGDMLNLPNGQILLINGAKKGASGWLFADDPNLEPLLYDPYKPLGQRFKTLAPTTIPRMYHSTSAVLPDGKILVAGSNTNPMYQFVDVKFITEVRVEKFSPPYLDAQLDNVRPDLVLGSVTPKVKYQGEIGLEFKVGGEVKQEDVMVTIYQPPFTTHGYSQNQRLLILPVVNFQFVNGQCTMKVTAPVKSDLAPPGYYLLFVNHKGVPSKAAWVQLQL